MMRARRTYRRDYANYRRDMSITKRWKRKEQERKLEVQRLEVELSGLLNTGAQAAFFKQLGIGEERNLGLRAKGQWWAPAHLVRMNRYFIKYGISSKVRTRAIRNYLEGKEPPSSILDALAGYTEEQLLRK